MAVYVVLGCHRAGTSLVADILRRMGVDMGKEFPRTNKHNPWGYWEDTDWMRLNIHILRAAGGKWNNPPSVERVLNVRERMEGEIKALITRKNTKQRWGWKDPRTVLTIPIIHPYLSNPRYVVVHRDKRAIVNSLCKRHKRSKRSEWEPLVSTYLQRMDSFVKTVDTPVHIIRYEDLMSEKIARDTVEKLGWFLGYKRFRKQLEQGITAIHFR